MTIDALHIGLGLIRRDNTTRTGSPDGTASFRKWKMFTESIPHFRYSI